MPRGYLHGPMREAAGRLRLRYDEITRKHRGEQGRAREVAVIKELLVRFLPRKLAIATGEVVASDGTTSSQHDILIYDALETPVFDDSDGSVVVPIEGVYAVVEIASYLNAAKLREDALKIRRLKQMPKATEAAYWRRERVLSQGFSIYGREFRDFPVMGFCFGYESATLSTLFDELANLDGGVPPEERVDMICSLARGCVANGVPGKTTEGEQIVTEWSGFPTPTNVRFAIPLTPEREPGVALMLLYLLGFGAVVQAQTFPLRLVPYVEIREKADPEDLRSMGPKRRSLERCGCSRSAVPFALAETRKTDEPAELRGEAREPRSDHPSRLALLRACRPGLGQGFRSGSNRARTTAGRSAPSS